MQVIRNGPSNSSVSRVFGVLAVFSELRPVTASCLPRCISVGFKSSPHNAVLDTSLKEFEEVWAPLRIPWVLCERSGNTRLT